ncbi:MAG: hypothetical protein QOD63_2113, partial [Actinomycetota bacterium]|nr:hypothetical protein [Actinomycetota bacterium]
MASGSAARDGAGQALSIVSGSSAGADWRDGDGRRSSPPAPDGAGQGSSGADAVGSPAPGYDGDGGDGGAGQPERADVLASSSARAMSSSNLPTRGGSVVSTGDGRSSHVLKLG